MIDPMVILLGLASVQGLTLLTSALTLSSPLILAALGGLCSERSGVVNIGLEGKMLGAACAAGIVGQLSGNPVLAVLAGIGVGTALSLLHALLTQTFRMDHIISGMGINALAVGGTSLIAKTLSNQLSGRMASFPIFIYWVAAWTAVVGIWWYLKSTRGGLRLNAVGNDPDKARQMGVNPVHVRLFALLWTGIFCGLGGTLIVTNAGSFSDEMTAGRGYIALAALILGGWRPLPTLLACLAFGFFEAINLQMQGQSFFGQTIPREFWQSLPYLVTLVALAGFLGKNKPPSGLGRP